jgi:hypothetical protein
MLLPFLADGEARPIERAEIEGLVLDPPAVADIRQKRELLRLRMSEDTNATGVSNGSNW